MSGVWIGLFVALWAVVLLLVVLVLGLIRKVGMLQLAQDVPSEVAPSSGGPLSGKPAPGVPGFSQLTSAWDTSRSRVVLFLSSSCGPCRKLAGQLGEVAGDRYMVLPPREDVDLVVVTDPGGVELFDSLGAAQILVQSASEVSRAWSVPGTPFAVAIDAAGVVRRSAFANTADQIRELAGML
jgi:thiol-disulfide isomerase/thioredoxin